jgi:DNA topoisomerase III
MSAFRLIVAEKPSVARDIARTLGIQGGPRGAIGTGDVRVTWCLGHLAELAEPQAYDASWRAWRLDLLPMLPETFLLQPRKDGGVDQWKVVRELLRDQQLGEVVNACDAGREGELIFANVYQLAGCKAPVQRLWISSMTDQAIRQGFDRLRPGAEMADLEAAARCRSEADWLVGLNATRAMTIQMRSGSSSTLLSLGRVQTPTLALLAAREQAIEEFVPETFFGVKVKFGVPEGQWEASWTAPLPPGREKHGPHPDRLTAREDADAILARIAGRAGRVHKVERKKTREKPPLLYDLTNLQQEANKRLKLSAKQTLEVAQALYEKHKVLTYPRTDSRHLTSDQVPGLGQVIGSLRFGPYQQAADRVLAAWPRELGKRVVDDSEVSDHHAIIPTGVDPRQRGLDPVEKRLYDLVARRFLAVFHDDAVFATVLVDTHIGEDSFIAKGRSQLEAGWRAIDPPKQRKKEVLLPAVDVEDAPDQLEAKLHEGSTKPPRRYTEATLLGAMERAGEALDDAELKRAMKRNGLGTPATRAAIIETLIARTYVRRDDGSLIPTPGGRTLLQALPVPELRSPALTGGWEARLVAMSEGAEDRDRFMEDIRAFVERAIEAIRSMEVDNVLREALIPPAPTGGDLLGECPRCQGEVRQNPRGWRCLGCPLDIPGQMARRPVSNRMAKALLQHGKTKAVAGWKSRLDKPFVAGLELKDDGSVGFYFPEPDSLGDCPACGAPVRPRGKIVTCDTGRECPFVVFEEMSGRAIPVEAVTALLADGRSALIEGFVDREERAFDGVLMWRNQRVVVQRMDRRALGGPAGSCPRCGADVAFAGKRWSCVGDGCDLSLPGQVMGRELDPDDVAVLLRDGRTARLHGFRQKSGAVFKAALVLDGSGPVRIDYSKPDTAELERPPPGGPPFAFGARIDCPVCLEAAERQPGYVIRGRAAWGCSRWKQGCALRLPFEPLGFALDDEQAQRLLGKKRETVILKLPIGIAGVAARGRFVLKPDEDPCWQAVKIVKKPR